MRFGKIFLASAAAVFIFASCGKSDEQASSLPTTAVSGHMELEYADQFSVDHLENGCSLIETGGEKFLLIPENSGKIEIPKDTTPLYQPLENLYVASSASVDLFDGIDSLDAVKFVSTDRGDWSLPNVAKAMDDGEIAYVGKYRAPDFELLVDEKCGLAVENTMIFHNPDIKEQLEELGIPVIVDHSSYETHPLGRMEWIKLYGLLLGKSDEAEKFFNEKTALFNSVLSADNQDSPRKTVAFFYVSSSGYINVRRPGDYISRMIELAGGEYIIKSDENDGESAASTMNMQPEAFYEAAKDADILIYNSTVDGEYDSIDQLIEKCALLEDFKAVQNGDVWCTEQNMFQQTTGAADMIYDINSILNGTAAERTTYIYRLEQGKNS